MSLYRLYQTLPGEFIESGDLAKRIRYDVRTLRERLKDSLFLKDQHYVQPRRKILWHWPSILKRLADDATRLPPNAPPVSHNGPALWMMLNSIAPMLETAQRLMPAEATALLDTARGMLLSHQSLDLTEGPKLALGLVGKALTECVDLYKSGHRVSEKETATVAARCRAIVEGARLISGVTNPESTAPPSRDRLQESAPVPAATRPPTPARLDPREAIKRTSRTRSIARGYHPATLKNIEDLRLRFGHLEIPPEFDQATFLWISMQRRNAEAGTLSSAKLEQLHSSGVLPVPPRRHRKVLRDSARKIVAAASPERATELAAQVAPLPDLRHCPRCDQDKLVSEFGPNRSKPDGLANYCRTCMNHAHQANYLAPGTKDRHVQKAARRRSGLAKSRKAFVDSLLSGQCNQCGKAPGHEHMETRYEIGTPIPRVSIRGMANLGYAVPTILAWYRLGTRVCRPCLRENPGERRNSHRVPVEWIRDRAEHVKATQDIESAQSKSQGEVAVSAG